MTRAPWLMAFLRSLLRFAAIGIFAAAALVAHAQPSVPGEPARAEKQAPEARLRLPEKAFERRVKLAPVDAEDLEKVRAANQRMRAGTNVQPKRVAIGLTRRLEAQAVAADAHGLDWMPVADGLVAKLAVTSPEASAVRVALDLRNASPALEMVFVGSRTPGKLFGPYRAAEVADRSAPFWSPVTDGDTLTVEFFLPGGAPSGAEPRLADVGHLLVSPAERDAEKRLIDIGRSGSCNVDLACSPLNTSSAFRNLAQSVAKMVYTDGTFTYSCTGTLLNDSDPSTQRPYFYTANHCFDNDSAPFKTPSEMQAIAGTLSTYWFFEASACNSQSASSAWQQIASGATVLYNSPTSDALFLRLNRDPPAGAFFLGWDASPIAPGTSVVDVHHPQGDLKKVSTGSVLRFASWPSIPSSSYIEVRWSSGTTEFGSSGSGLFTFTGSQYLLRGGLRGGDALCSNPQGTDLFSRFDLVYPNIRQYLAATTGPDIHQPGLDGLWYNPATSGQGFALQVVPNVAPGRGYLQGGWFTFDAAPGGVDRQRWYTLGGDVFTGNSSANLTIYQNTGGNFVAPPKTTAFPVGTATLAFSSCTAGQLSYAFSDGRSGAIPITRIMPNMTCSTSSARPTNPDFALSGNWYDPATSGQGFIIEMNPASPYAFVTWYTYAAEGQFLGIAGQRWYTAQSSYVPGARTIGLTLYETTGGTFDSATPPSPATTPVGSATLSFTSCTAATFSYNFASGANAGRSGILALTRIGGAGAGCA